MGALKREDFQRLGIFLLLLGAPSLVGSLIWDQKLRNDQSSCFFSNAISGEYNECAKSNDPRVLLIGSITALIVAASTLVLSWSSNRTTK